MNGCEQLPPPPGDADESRVASLRSTWTRIKPAGPVEYQTGWQIAKPDVMYLLDLAEEALLARRGLTKAVAPRGPGRR